MDKLQLRVSTHHDTKCNICYVSPGDNDSKYIKLKCCKYSKNICHCCLKSLRTKTCPFCINQIDRRCIPYMKPSSLLQNRSFSIARSDPIPIYYQKRNNLGKVYYSSNSYNVQKTEGHYLYDRMVKDDFSEKNKIHRSNRDEEFKQTRVIIHYDENETNNNDNINAEEIFQFDWN